MQASCIHDSSLLEFDPTNQLNDLLANGIFALAFKYEMGVRIIRLYKEYSDLIPSYYAGSLDGEFMWATLLHSYSGKDLYPWIWWKYLSILIDSICICFGLVSNNQISKALKLIGFAIHWTRKLNVFYHIAIGYQVPWLLWVPDTIVLIAAFLFDLGLYFGVSSSKDEQQAKKTNKKRKDSSSRTYHTRSALSNPSNAVKEIAKSLSKKI